VKPAAFILLGGLRVIVRNWHYLTELERRGLKILVVTSEQWRAETVRRMGESDGPGSLIHDAAFVDGSVTVEGSFTAGVVASVRRWLESYAVVGVFAAGEMLVEQTGIVADALGLPGPGLRASRVCRSKYLQRLYLQRWAPKAAIIPPSERATPHVDGFEYPAVLKPSGRRSSSGVRAVTSREHLLACLVEYTAQEALLLEEYVHGQEYSVEALVQRGEVIFDSVTHKVTNEIGTDRFVELGHSVPATGDPGHAALLAAGRDVIARLEVADGVVHAEFRLTGSGAVVLMEVAARTPGDGILPLYHLATGAPMEPEIIRIALGEAAAYPSPRRFARQVYLEHDAGVLDDVVVRWPGVEPVWVGQEHPWPPFTPGEADDAGALRGVLVAKQRGAVVGVLRESDDRAVTFLIDAPSPEELDDLEKRVRNSIDVITKP
jgi:ATP-grasp domain